MKRLFLKKISLVLVLVMLLSLTGVAEDGGTEVTVTAIDVDEIVIPAFEDLPDQAGLDLSIESSLTVEEDEEDESSTEAPLSESASDDNAVRENALPKKITLGVKETYTLSAKNATFKSSKTSVATVNKKGVITAKKKGTAKITVMSGKKKVGTCTVTVVAAPKKVSLGMTDAAMGLKETLTLVPVITDKSHTTFTYTTKNKKIATVSTKGVITAKKVGSTIITVKTHNGKTSSIKVAVKKAPTKVTVKPKTLSLEVGQTANLIATLPNKTASFKLTWTSDNENVATVDENGTVTAVMAGEAKITIKTFNKMKAVSTVRVIEPTPTEAPTAAPTEAPTSTPTEAPTAAPTEAPTAAPTEAPTAAPTLKPLLKSAAAETETFNLKPADTATLKVNTVCDGTPTLTYKWFGNGAELAGETGSSCIVTAGSVSSYVYNCEVTDGENKCEAEFTVNVSNSLTASAVGETEQTVFVNEKATLKVEATCLTADKLTVKWYRGSETEPVGTGSEFTTETLDQAGKYTYRCVVDDGYGSALQTVEFTVTATTPKLKRAYADTTAFTVSPNQTVALGVKTECYGTPALSYAWTLDDQPLENADNAASYTTRTEAAATVGERLYKCTVSDGTEQTPAVVTFTVTVDNALAASASVATEQTIFVGTTATLAVEATCTVGDPTYQWYMGDNQTPIEGATGASYTTGAITADTSFRCVVGDAYGSTTVPVTFTVNTKVPSLTNATAQTGTFSLKPTDEATLQVNLVCDGEPTLSYAWYEGESETPFSSGNVDGYTAVTYDITASAVGTKTYQCDVNDGTTTKSVSFTVTADNALAASASVATEQRIFVGTTATLAVEATCTVGDPTYQWYMGDNQTPIEGATGVSYTTGAITADTTFKCVVGDVYGSIVDPIVFTITAIKPTVSILFDGEAVAEGVNQLTTTSVTASWTVSEGLEVEHYYYKVLDSTGADVVQQVETDTANYTLSTEILEIGKVYTLRIGVLPKNSATITWNEAQFKWGSIVNGFVMYNGVVTGYTGEGGAIVIPGLDGNGNDIVAIGAAAFEGNPSITSIVFPATLTEIGKSAFEGCTGIESVVIPNEVKEIGVAAFKNCEKLKSMNSFD